MAAIETRESAVYTDGFVRQMVAHHRTGDHYPDPWVIANELRFSRAQTEAILRDLRAIGWIAASPYGPERLRLTPRCWDTLRRSHRPQPASARNAA